MSDGPMGRPPGQGGPDAVLEDHTRSDRPVALRVRTNSSSSVIEQLAADSRV